MRAAVGLAALLLSSCAHRPADGDPSTPLARFAGIWQVAVRDSAGQPLPPHTITATSGTSGWSQGFPNRPPIPVRVVDSSGDLIVSQAGPYESVLRPGVTVTVLFVTRLVTADSTTGSMVAWYEGAEPIPVVRARTDGVRSRP